MSTPLVVIDADVLGRQRTGDESYVASLLRELPAHAAGFRIAAVTRRPDLVPEGDRADRARRGTPAPAHGNPPSAAAATSPSCARALPPRRPARVARPLGTDGAGPVLRALPRSDEPQRPLLLPNLRATVGPARRPSADRLGVDEAGPRRALRRGRGADRRHAVRRRPDVPSGRAAPRAAAVRALRRGPPGAEAARAGAPGAEGSRLGSPARLRRPRSRARARAPRGGAHARPRTTAWSSRAMSRATSWRRSTAEPPASCFRLATRASACRCSRRWPRGRPSSPRASSSIPEVAGDAAILVDARRRRARRRHRAGRRPSATVS